jgi:hypothetical protein
MKTLSPIAFLAALVALFVFPMPFEIGASIVFAAGLGAVAVSDYTRALRPRLIPAPAPVDATRKERLGLAA